MTTFKYALQACGLTQTEAAEFLGKSLKSVKNYSRGKSNAPPECWEMLSNLYADIEDISNQACEVMDLDGIDFRAYRNISAPGPTEYELPLESCADMAGALGLLKALQYHLQRESEKGN